MNIPLVDSHCHLDFPELASRREEVLAAMAHAGVGWALCAGVTLERFPTLLQLVHGAQNVFAAVGVHPDTENSTQEPTIDVLTDLAKDEKVVAIGETGLDYYRLSGDLEWQRERFRTHIRAARACGKPLIIHTRAAAPDTLRILKEEGADHVGGVFHCFTESADVARAALDLGFYISFSGIVTFPKATEVKEVSKMVPLDRLLIETDSPYLAPVPFRGKLNQPAYVVHVAEEIARLRQIRLETLAAATTENFFRLFNQARR